MQLPFRGHPIHTRSLTLVVTLRPDGAWHARGDVIDLRKTGFVPLTDDIQAAGIIHRMAIDLAIDPAAGVIDAVDVEQPVVAIEPSEATGGECCRDPAGRLQAMVGASLGDGLARRLAGAFGGPLGCSHLLTLFQMMGPACVRALDAEASLDARARRARCGGERIFRRSLFVDGLEGEGDEIALVLQQSDFHTTPAGVVASPFERLAGEWAVRAEARVGAGMVLSGVAARERHRTHATLGTAAWIDRSDRLASIDGAPILPGLARRLLAALDTDEDGRLLEAMLQLAPGHVQVMAAVMDRFFARGAGAPAGAGPGRVAASGLAAIGGMPDSCYMWRAGGALASGGFGHRGPTPSEGDA